jgi:hypothetical protein
VSVGGRLDHLFAGGYVLENDPDVRLVRLIDANGTILEDKVEDGFVLFLACQKVHLPLRAELYDLGG